MAADDRAASMLRNMEAASAAADRRVGELAFAAPVGNDLGTTNDKSVKITLLAFPGEDALAHEGERWIESTERR